MKKFLILQLRPETDASGNEYQAILKFGNLKAEETERIRIEQNGIPDLDLENYSGMIVGGSPFDISTKTEDKSLIQKKIEADFEILLKDVIEKDFPFFGACSGNGLLGKQCGSVISKKYGEAVGGVDITLTEEGKKDQLLVGLPETFRVLVGHKEACDSVPKNAVLLASSASCPVQMFRVKNNIYATQFHPEGDAQGFIVRINTYKHHGYFPAEDAERLITLVEKEETPYAHEILRRFVEIYRG